MASTTQARAERLKTKPLAVTPSVTLSVVENFAVFIDTHRDQPHVPTFEDDIHRGMTRPTIVHYAPPTTSAPDDLGALVRAEDNRVIDVDVKHRFVEMDWWRGFIVGYMAEHGVSPIAMSGETRGQMPTAHLRDARHGVYRLKSLRQIIRSHEAAGATLTGTPYKPSRVGSRAAKLGVK